MAAFQSYGGVYGEDGRAIRWSCYATCPVYEVRPFGEPLPPAEPSAEIRDALMQRIREIDTRLKALREEMEKAKSPSPREREGGL